MDTISFITIHNLSFSWQSAALPVFSGLNLHFPQGWTGITGPNGGGKTTLLKLICGILQPESGVIMPKLSEAEGAVYCPQQSGVLPDNWESAFSTIDSIAGRILALLQIGDDWLFRWETLSGGEQKRLQLAAALCRQAPVIALDEPTNHLDRQSRGYIIQALQEYQGIGLLVSHDRELMDRLCDWTLFLSHNEAQIYPGGAGKALKLREDSIKSRMLEWQKAEDSVKKAERFSQRQAEEVSRSKGRMSLAHVSSSDHDAKAKIRLARLTGKDAVAANQKHKANTLLESAQTKREVLDKPSRRKEGITLMSDKVRQDYICKISAGKITGGTYCLTVPELVITPNARIALTGDNGTGKTLLIKRIIQEIKIGAVFYLPQEITQETIREFFDNLNNLEKTQKAAVLSAFYRLGGNPERIQEKECPTVSPGELRKLFIAEALTRSPVFIIMDEPTNYMDISSVQLLEEALRTSTCALLLASHDRVFLRRLTNESWTLERQNEGEAQLT